MDEIIQVREQIDRQVRPGQKGVGSGADRLADPVQMSRGKVLPCNVWDPAAGVERRYGLYGRGRYGRERYLAG